MNSVESQDTLRVTLDVWHPGCWVLDVTKQIDIGLLGHGIYTGDDGYATTHYTAYGDTLAIIDEGLPLIRNHSSVYSVAEMTDGYRHPRIPTPGNATRNLLIEHDGTTQISEAFTSRGFAYAAPADAHDDSERWTLITSNDRETIKARLDEIRTEENAEITLESIMSASRAAHPDSLPLDRLSHRQREIFQLARRRGYYRHPKETSAGELATELDITTSTLHEHLHKVEEIMFDLS